MIKPSILSIAHGVGWIRASASLAHGVKTTDMYASMIPHGDLSPSWNGREECNAPSSRHESPLRTDLGHLLCI